MKYYICCMRKLFFALTALSLLACNNQTSPENSEHMDSDSLVIDIHTAAKPQEAVVKHLHWDAVIEMEHKRILATAHWDIVNAGSATKIIFDTKGLKITRVTLDADTGAAGYKLNAPDPVLGSALEVSITSSTKRVNISYETQADAAALQWLSPEQTAGKRFPFLFTQSQAILARTWIPCQDSPGIRFSYSADVTVPKDYLALMSAKNPTEKNSEGKYHFEQPKPIPAYLMALAVGNIDFKPLGDRTGVYAEPVTLTSAAYEFEDMGKMLSSAEQLYGKYAWNRYDVLVLPPSFPFGGMENPELTFATPTILAGDRSLVSLIAHELAHSWSGNLVTNATWNDFWLNEGFTVYFERRIMEAISGKSYADMLAYLGYGDLKQTVADLNAENMQNDTRLKLDLTGRDPDDGVTDIAYEKGYLFLCQIEKLVGRPKFDNFLKNYFQGFAFKTMTTEQFVVYLKEKLITPESGLEKELNIQQWIYDPGIPEGITIPSSERFVSVEKQAGKFFSGTLPQQLETSNWSSHEWQYFLRFLMPNLDAQKMTELDQVFHFTATKNSEIAALWLQAAIQAEYKPAYAALDEFLMRVGRRKFIKPLYETMRKNTATKEMGKVIYKKARGNYHAVSTNTLDKLMGWPY